MTILANFIKLMKVFFKTYPIIAICMVIGYIIGNFVSKFIDWIPLIGNFLGFLITLLVTILFSVIGYNYSKKSI